MKRTAIICGFNQTSLGTLRCLSRVDAELWLVGSKDHVGPAYYSNIPLRRVTYDHTSNLVSCLCSLVDSSPDKPALLLTEDRHVVEIARNIDVIKRHYRILLPQTELVDVLMDKARFATIAKRNGYRIPKTTILEGKEQLNCVKQNIPFPFLLKPYLLHSRKINSEADLANYLSKFTDVNYKSMIIQEWIPGSDNQIYFCFLFFDADSNVRASFVARKIRQYPLQYGTTSYCVSTSNDEVLRQSISIFKELNYRGFCSIEYKYDQRNSEYVIMEPTVGRFNQQIALTAAAGINFPSIILEYLYGNVSDNSLQINGKYWVYETNDFFSSFRSNSLLSYLPSITSASSRVLFSRRDPFPLFAEVADIVSRWLNGSLKRIRNSRRL